MGRKLFKNLFQYFKHSEKSMFKSYPKFSMRFVLGGLLIGFAVRIGMLWFVDFRVDAGDATGYLASVHNLINHHILSEELSDNPSPSTFRPPLYPFFVALITGIFGHSLFSIQISQVVISLITGLLITIIAAKIVPKAAPWVFLLAMISPFEAVYTGAVLSETVTAFLLVATFFTIMVVKGVKRWAIGGILLGLCVLTRDIYGPLVLLISMSWLLIGAGRMLYRARDVGVLVISMLLVITPWTIRNHHVSDRWIFVSEGRLGYSLWAGTWAIDGKFTKNEMGGNPRVYPPEAFRNASEKELITGIKDSDHAYRSLAIKRIIEEPGNVLMTYLIRAPLLWLGTRFDIFQLNASIFPYNSSSWIVVKSILWGINSLLLLSAILGACVAWHRRYNVVIISLPILYTALIYFPLPGFENRYSQPVYPFLLVFAGIFISFMADKFSSSSKFK